MASSTYGIIPLIKNRLLNVKKTSLGIHWGELSKVMNAYGIRLTLLTCISPVLTILPALALQLAHDTYSIIGYIIAILMLIPWLIVPTLFIQHITSQSLFGKIASYIYAGVLFVTFLLWLTIIKF